MNYDSSPSFRTEPLSSGRAAGFSTFIYSTYRWMALGLALTGLTAWAFASSPALSGFLFSNRILFFGLLLGEFALVATFSTMAARLSTPKAALMFLGYSFLNGVTFSTVFYAYTQASLAQTFFVTAGSFAGLSLYGATTKRDLSPVGHFMGVGLIGLIIASLINIFLKSPAIYWVSTYAGVLIFAGLTAYDNQKLRQMYAATGNAGNLALRGALTLYLDFVNMFLMLLRLFGDRR